MNRWLPFEWIAATRFMREGLMQTLLIILGIALGVGVIVFMSALLSGLQDNLFRRTLEFQAQVILSAPRAVAHLPPQAAARMPGGEAEAPTRLAWVQPRAQRLQSIDQWQPVLDRVAALPDVVAASPVLSGAGFAVRGDANRSVSVTGIEPESYARLIPLARRLVAGTITPGPGDILVGTELATDLGIGLGNRLTLHSAAGSSMSLTVAGVLDFGNKALNQRATYVSLRTAQSLLDLPGGITSIELNGNDPFAAESLAEQIRSLAPLQVESWISTNAQFFSAVAAQQMSSNVIRFFVGLTAALGIASVLVVSVVQKAREIGILRATGTSRGQIQRVFLLQGALMGLLGSIAGSALGWVFLAGWRLYARTGGGTGLFTITFEPALFVWAAVGTTVVGTLAALFPARRAARLDPVVAIRG